MTVVNLRGANGSGKSTVAFALMTAGLNGKPEEVQLARYETPKGAERFVTGYRIPERDMIIVGPYRSQCGGCDGIKTQQLIKDSVLIAARKAKHVFFEGVIVSTLFSGYLALSEQLRASRRVGEGNGLVWAYLDTPLETCLSRIQARNGGKPINEQLVADKIKSIESTRLKAIAALEPWKLIKHKKATQQVLELFE